MKEHPTHVCPGCSRHCRADCVRCRYGRNYFAGSGGVPEAGKKPKRKWEKHVAAQGPLWQLLTTGRRVKKALLSGKVREEQLLEGLTGEERERLTELLKKMG